MNQGFYLIKENTPISRDIYRMILEGDTSEIKESGQFINLKIEGLYLRRPISICDYDAESLTILYKVVGEGTRILAGKSVGESLDCLVGLGNGFVTKEMIGNKALIIGGGIGIPPLYNLAKRLLEEKREVSVILGFNRKEELFYLEEFKELTAKVYVATMDGSYGIRGTVLDVIREKNPDYDFYATCGPEKMLQGVHNILTKPGFLSFESRMGCGFGACMGCSCKTLTGSKRICVEGPVLKSEEVIFHV